MTEPSAAAPPAVLTLAATDPTSGAGLQADILTFASMGCLPLSVVTAITVQDTAGVESFLALDPDWVADQARCLLEDIPGVAFKMGVLASVEIVTVVAEVVSDYPDIPLVPTRSSPRAAVTSRRRRDHPRSASCWCPRHRGDAQHPGAAACRTAGRDEATGECARRLSTWAASTYCDGHPRPDGFRGEHLHHRDGSR
jgi:hypothetical protein